MLKVLRSPLIGLAVFAGPGCGGSNPPSPAAPEQPLDLGVVVMAHGGTAQWNDEVEAAVDPLRARYPVAVAFGMADPATLQVAVSQVERQGASRIAVVRLFISGDSWRVRTEQILGVRPGAPLRAGPPAAAAGHEHGGGEPAGALWRIGTRARLAMSQEGLAEAAGMGEVLLDRARALSADPRREVVLIMAHGPGDPAENARWISWIEARAETVRRALPFRRVLVMTLREDWPEHREVAVREIRSAVQAATSNGHTALVIPYRVQGFGPYAEVLDGLRYLSDGRGLLPHPAVTRWIADQVEEMRRGVLSAAP